jgi:hypothetical protein
MKCNLVFVQDSSGGVQTINLDAGVKPRVTAMLRDDSNNGAGRRQVSRNVLGEPLEACSIKPMTGFYRDGCCNTGREDIGSHTICAVMTSAFLDFSKSRGNDLSTPVCRNSAFQA